jgi:ATP-dependent RNA helicase DDX54/DBP10
LAGDETFREKRKHQLTWDKKKKKFITGDGAGADNVKLVKTESGTRLPATYRSGRYDEWKSKTRVSLPRVGEAENPGRSGAASGGKRFKHSKVTSAKPLDKFRTDYERKARLKKQQQNAKEDPSLGQPSSPGKGPRRTQKRYGSKSYGQVKSELRTADQIRKMRKTKDQRRAKNARPSKKKRR